ncbi:amidohydrolase [Chryseolinea lacunae]|uniref:Amidohydrolase n=1 Tax=Chryseolinea lacunae TaxID=2801331 RepID=A0ABS1KRX6_9BACT|nr:amidohydrolase [Chryseolinea lacunae]MBL0742194.1 amidohydrolase [Chryseolinea lacunae]
MMKTALTTGLLCASLFSFAQKTKPDVAKAIDAKYQTYADVAKKIWDFAEVGYQETKSSALLQETLTQAGFKVENNIAGMPTAFIATFGSGKPVIGILGEYDALPGISQDAVPEKKTIDGKTAGHACGHHLFGTASAAAAIEIKNWLQATKKSGTLRFYGTPAEEGGSGKVYLVRDGLFKDVDVVLHWHPGDGNSASTGGTLANKNGKFRFYGVASHAAASPERGRSSLDAVEAMDAMVNMMREHVSQETRIHYVITRGGEAPNVVPAFAEVYYYVRHPKREDVKSTWDRIVKAAQGAALGTETRMEVEVTGGVYNMLPNETLARVMDKNLHAVGGYTYTPEEKSFATKIQSTFTTNVPKLESTNEVEAFKIQEGPASTDVGDVSWVVPTVGLSTATWVPGTAAHSWQAVAAGGTTIGYKGMIVAAKAIAFTAMDLFESPAVIAESWKELKKRTGESFTYEALVGDRKPALNYRN